MRPLGDALQIAALYGVLKPLSWISCAYLHWGQLVRNFIKAVTPYMGVIDMFCNRFTCICQLVLLVLCFSVLFAARAGAGHISEPSEKVQAGQQEQHETHGEHETHQHHHLQRQQRKCLKPGCSRDCASRSATLNKQDTHCVAKLRRRRHNRSGGVQNSVDHKERLEAENRD